MITLDREGCIGCGACVSLCPHNFNLDDDGKASVISQEIIDCTQEASDSCPVNVIKIN
jgi:ferredoxin